MIFECAPCRYLYFVVVSCRCILCYCILCIVVFVVIAMSPAYFSRFLKNSMHLYSFLQFLQVFFHCHNKMLYEVAKNDNRDTKNEYVINVKC